MHSNLWNRLFFLALPFVHAVRKCSRWWHLNVRIRRILGPPISKHIMINAEHGHGEDLRTFVRGSHRFPNLFSNPTQQRSTSIGQLVHRLPCFELSHGPSVDILHRLALGKNDYSSSNRITRKCSPWHFFNVWIACNKSIASAHSSFFMDGHDMSPYASTSSRRNTNRPLLLPMTIETFKAKYLYTTAFPWYSNFIL